MRMSICLNAEAEEYRMFRVSSRIISRRIAAWNSTRRRPI